MQLKNEGVASATYDFRREKHYLKHLARNNVATTFPS